MMTTDQTLEWHISVDGATEKGHPIQRIEMNFGCAAQTFDQMDKEYPDKTVRMFVVNKTEIKSRKPLKRALADPICPRGHSGKRDGRRVVSWTQSGAVQCSICGYLGA